MNAATRFVNAGRIYNLALGIARTDTSTRLREFGNRHALPQREDQAMENRINPDDLCQLERCILKEALPCARELQSCLTLDYQL